MHHDDDRRFFAERCAELEPGTATRLVALALDRLGPAKIDEGMMCLDSDCPHLRSALRHFVLRATLMFCQSKLTNARIGAGEAEKLISEIRDAFFAASKALVAISRVRDDFAIGASPKRAAAAERMLSIIDGALSHVGAVDSTDGNHYLNVAFALGEAGSDLSGWDATDFADMAPPRGAPRNLVHQLAITDLADIWRAAGKPQPYSNKNSSLEYRSPFAQFVEAAWPRFIGDPPTTEQIGRALPAQLSPRENN